MIGTGRQRWWMVAAALAGLGSACLIEPNPDFTGAEPSDTGPSNECPPGTLDCDGEPGCEASSDDPLTCGSCNKPCVVGGELLECVVGRCVGTVVLTDLEDTYADRDAPDQAFGTELELLADSRRTAYIKLPSLSSDASYERIDLSLPCLATGATVEIRRLKTDWEEPTLTWNNAPTVVGGTFVSFEPELGDNVIDLLGRLPSWPGDTTKHSLALRSTIEVEPPEDGIVFASRETGAGPSLTITLSW